jgi:hypothetical protein
MANYRSVTLEIVVKDWCTGIKLGVCIEIVSPKFVRNTECKSVLAPDTANASSGIKFLPRAYTSQYCNPEATFKFWLHFETFRVDRKFCKGWLR